MSHAAKAEIAEAATAAPTPTQIAASPPAGLTVPPMASTATLSVPASSTPVPPAAAATPAPAPAHTPAPAPAAPATTAPPAANAAAPAAPRRGLGLLRRMNPTWGGAKELARSTVDPLRVLGAAGSEGLSEMFSKAKPEEKHDDSDKKLEALTLVTTEDAHDDGWSNVQVQAPAAPSPGSGAVQIDERFQAWLASNPIVRILDISPEKNLELYRQTLAALLVPLGSDLKDRDRLDSIAPDLGPNADAAAKRAAKRSVWAITDLIFGRSVDKATHIQQQQIAAMRRAVTTQLKQIKAEKNPDKVFVKAVVQFHDDVLRAKADQLMSAGGTLGDLMEIFEAILTKTAMNEQALVARQRKGAPIAQHEQRDTEELFRARLQRFGDMLLSAMDSSVVFKDAQVSTDVVAHSNLSLQDKLIMHVRNALSITEENHATTFSSVGPTVTQKKLFAELSLALVLLDNHPHYNLTTLQSLEAFDLWKARETKEILELMRKVDKDEYESYMNRAKSKSLITGNTRIRIRVVEARNLTGKDKTGFSDPYVTIEYDKDIFTTNVCGQTLNPKWDEQVTLTLKELTGEIVLSVWDKDTEESGNVVFSKKFWKDDVDDFLGMLTFRVEKILERGFEPWDEWHPLQKRSKRSHISGDIHLVILNVPPEATTHEIAAVTRATADVGTADYYTMYLYLMRSLMSYDYLSSGRSIKMGSITTASERILTEYATRYRVSHDYQAVARLALLTAAYLLMSISLEELATALKAVQALLKQNAPMTQDERATVGRCEEMLYAVIKAQLIKYAQTFPYAKPQGAIQTALGILADIYSDAIFVERNPDAAKEPIAAAVRTILTEGAVARYRYLSEESMPTTPNFVTHMLGLLDRIMTTLDDDEDHFQAPFAERLPIDLKTINAMMFIKFLTLEIETACADPKTVGSHAAEGLKLYPALKHFQKHYVDVDVSEDHAADWARLRENFDVERWLVPFVKAFLLQSHQKVLDWAKKAIELDDFKPVTADAGYSTSVVDLFNIITSVFELLKKQLHWADEVQEAKFLSDFAWSVSNVIQQYCQDLCLNVQTAFRRVTSEMEGRSKVHFGSIRKSGGASPIEEVMRLNCIKLNNLEAVRQRLHDLYTTMDVDGILLTLEKHRNEQQQLAESESPTSASGLTGSIKLDVLSATSIKACDPNGKSDPYVVVSVISKEVDGVEGRVVPRRSVVNALRTATGDFGHVVATTTIKFGTLHPVWNQTFEFSVRNAIRMHFRVYDHDLFTMHDICGDADLDLIAEDVGDAHYHDVVLGLDPQGDLQIRLVFESGTANDIGYHFSFAFRAIKRFMSDMSGIFVDALAPEMREHVRRIVSVAKPKAGWFSSKPVATQAEITDTDVQAALEPLTTALQASLRVLADQLWRPMMETVVVRAWKAVLLEFKMVLVPTMEEDVVTGRTAFGFQIIPGSRDASVSPRQVKFVAQCVEALRVYFFEDGEGLPLKSLDNSSYAEIKTMCTLYDWPTANLTQRYLQLLDPAAEVAPATAPPPILTPSPGPKVAAAASSAEGGTGDGGEDDETKARKAAERRSNKLALKRSEEMHVILQVLQLRGEDRVAQDFAKDMTLNMSHARKWAGK